MNKRNIENLLTDTHFAVIETIRRNADIVVEFIPQSWLKPMKNNKPIKVRETAKCYYPRRMDNQNKDQYLKYLKHAKFECLQPKEDNKWDLLDCKVLKIGIGCFTEAVNAEKIFSDFFNTTDAEAEMAGVAAATASANKRLRKTKKPKQNEPSESDSDDEDGKVVAGNEDIPSYNANFKHPIVLTSGMTGCSSTDMDAGRINSLPDDGWNDTFDIRGRQLPSLNIDLSNTIEIVDVEANEALTLGQDLATSEEISQFSVFEFEDQQHDNVSKSKCNCCQKLMNKMDYMQKKFLKELGRYRQETLQAVRKFSDKYDVLLKSLESNTPELANQKANQVQNDEFEFQFKNQFPVASKLALIETNETIRTERDFKRRLISKLKCIVKEEKTNETKVIRLLLKSICSSTCLSDFTWLGTDKKANFSELEALIEVITIIVEFQFPGCDAFSTLKRVVQQRTKSAAEFEAKAQKRLNIAALVAVNNFPDLVDNAAGMEESSFSSNNC